MSGHQSQYIAVQERFRATIDTLAQIKEETMRTVDADGDHGGAVAGWTVGDVVPGGTQHLVVSVREEVLEVLAVAFHFVSVDKPLVHRDGRVDGLKRANKRDANRRVEPQRSVVQRRRRTVPGSVVVQRDVVRTF